MIDEDDLKQEQEAEELELYYRKLDRDDENGENRN